MCPAPTTHHLRRSASTLGPSVEFLHAERKPRRTPAPCQPVGASFRATPSAPRSGGRGTQASGTHQHKIASIYTLCGRRAASVRPRIEPQPAAPERAARPRRPRGAAPRAAAARRGRRRVARDAAAAARAHEGGGGRRVAARQGDFPAKGVDGPGLFRDVFLLALAPGRARGPWLLR
jgi:hypothetical protein